MKKYLLVLFLLTCSQSIFAQNDSITESIKKFQNELNSDYKNPNESPLPQNRIDSFEGHDFYAVNLDYYVKAKFVRTPGEPSFGMITSTSRRPEYVVYGHLIFDILGETFQLDVFQSTDLSKDEAYKNYLFLPFTDSTNGEETYPAGRYIDLMIPDGNEIFIDFNKSYNPYCAYNHKYSCPVPPAQNHLKTYIKAGIKKP